MARLDLVALRCPGCGGDLQYVPGAPIASCPYCDAKIALVNSGPTHNASLDGNDYRMLPFRMDRNQFRDRFLEFLSEGDYTPPDVFSMVEVRNFTGLFAATYLWEGSARVAWSAAAGFTREETYVTTRTVSRNGKTVTEPTTGTRSVTDWRPVSGDLLHDYRLVAQASDAIPDSLSALIEESGAIPPLDRLPVVDPEATRGFAIEPFRHTPSEVWDRSAKKRLNEEIETRVKSAVPGDKADKIQFSSSRSLEACTRLYRPMWLALYQYNGTQFAFAMDGSAGKVLGTRPMDFAQRDRIKKLEDSIKNAGIFAMVAGILSFFVIPFVGAIIVGVLWYLYTDGQKKLLRVEKKKISDARKAREDAMARIKSGAATFGERPPAPQVPPPAAPEAPPAPPSTWGDQPPPLPPGRR